jgi:hypothetical protein
MFVSSSLYKLLPQYLLTSSAGSHPKHHNTSPLIAYKLLYLKNRLNAPTGKRLPPKKKKINILMIFE